MSKKNSNNINKSTVSSGNKFSDDSVINKMDVLPSTKSIKMPIKFNVDFDPLIGYVNSEVTLAMSPDSTGLFTIGNNVDKYTGISKEETKEAVESGMETPDDAVIYGMCNVMNNGDDIFFWTNGTRLAGASDKTGIISAINEQLSHECLHLTRLILNKHILKNKGINNWVESDWLSIGDQDDDIQEESFATALGLITEQVTPKFIEMASEYIPELKNSTLPKAQKGLDFQSRLNQYLKPSTFSPNILGRSSGKSNFGYEYKAGPFTQSTMFASDRRLAPVDKFTFASDNPTNTQLSLNTGLNYKDKYGFKGAASYANTTAKNDPNAKFNVGYNRKGLTADYNYNYNKENPSQNLSAGYRGQGVTADFKMSKDKKTPYTYDTNVGYKLDGVSGKFRFTGNKETPKYTFGVGYDKKGVTGEFTATKDQKKPFVYNANLGYNKDGFSTGLEFSGNKENPNYTYRVKYEPEKQGFTTDSNLKFTKGNIDATTGLGYKNKNINTGLSYKTSIDRENESQQNSLGANFGYRNKNFNTGVNYERRFATEEDPASNKIGVNVGYRNKSGIGVNAGVNYKTLSEAQKLQDKASPFEFRAGVTYTPQRKKQQTPTKKFTFSKEDVKKEPINIKDLPAEFKKRFGGQHIYHDLFQKGGRKTKNGITILNPIEEATYQDWRKSLPSNLQNDTSDYDLRGAWATGIQPELFYYDEQGKFQSAHPIDVNEPGSIYQPHLFSIDPDTGRYLKSPTHDTYLHAIEGDIKAGYTPYINVKTGHMYVKPYKKKQGGTVINESDVIAQGGLYIQPTAQDSSDVYNRSKELQDYFKNKGYESQGTTKLAYNNSNIFKRELDRLYGQFINQQSTNYPTSTGGSTSSKLDPKYYRKPTNPNKPTIIEQRESQFGTLDTRAPFGYYDTRIVPKEMSSYKNVNMKDPLRGDEVNIPIYDISVKPYAMRTPAEQAEVERKYGKPKPIVKPVFKDQQEADYPKSNSKAETVQSSDYSKYLNLTPEDVLDKYSFDEYSKAFGLDPVTMRNQINKNIKWDKISNLGEFDTEKFLTRKLYDYIQDNPPKAQKGDDILYLLDDAYGRQRLQSYGDSLNLHNNYLENKNIIQSGNKFYNNVEIDKPFIQTVTGKYNIPNPNNPLTLHTVTPDLSFFKISDKGYPTISALYNKNIQPTATEIYTRKESKYKSLADYEKNKNNIKNFSEGPQTNWMGVIIPAQANWIGYQIQKYKKPVQPIVLQKTNPVINTINEKDIVSNTPVVNLEIKPETKVTPKQIVPVTDNRNVTDKYFKDLNPDKKQTYIDYLRTGVLTGKEVENLEPYEIQKRADAWKKGSKAKGGNVIHESNVIRKAQTGDYVNIDGKIYNINSPEYRSLYNQGVITALEVSLNLILRLTCSACVFSKSVFSLCLNLI